MKSIMAEATPPPRQLELFVLCLAVCLFGIVEFAVAQNNQTQASTDPAEVRALNSIFQQWGISANRSQWNISGEPCSRDAIDPNIDWGYKDWGNMSTERNPFIKCNCTYESNTLCHITQLKVYQMNVDGVLPHELYTLTYLTHVFLHTNYLTGSISPSIGNLTRLQHLQLGLNALSGKLPRELGMLSEMKIFGIGSNNFSGPLPSELGSWTNLQQLKFRGNAFEGPIPASFSKLTSLEWLAITDLSNGGSSLAFIREMRSLGVLELRNNNISDSIPSNIGEYQNLTLLDLSFNNINGQIPDALFRSSSLTHVFLGNNRLNGTLPAAKSPTLLNIDVSYNNLMGSLPSWVSEGNVQLNFVANNFTIEDFDSSGIPSGLECLQRSFPCNKGFGIYSNFGINCGGPKITSSKGLVFENDDPQLGLAASFVSDTRTWGVSNVGYFTGLDNPQYTFTRLSQFTNTLDSELFQTARVSASSLRYYGLGLENGNYTVTLRFAEIAFSNTSRTWQSLWRRIFDVYVQGKRVIRDFNIRREAAVEKIFTAQVTENNIEVHLFWAGKGTTGIPLAGLYGPLISAISATPDFNPTMSNNPPSTRGNRTGMIVGTVVGVVIVILLSVLVISFILKRRKKLADGDEGYFLEEQ